MDDTSLDSSISELATVDPADAPDLADSVAEELTAALEADPEDGTPASPA